MRRLVFELKKDDKISHMEFITDRTPGWTVTQFIRNRPGLIMTLISNESTDQKETTSREITLNNNEK